jgi:retinol dehydrogenase-12
MPFSENDIPDLKDKVVIVTGNALDRQYHIVSDAVSLGGNSGIGKQTVAVLASKGAKVYLAARSAEKYQKAVEEIHDSHPDSTYGQIEFLRLDLSTATSALAAANDFKTCVVFLNSPRCQ